MRFEIFDFSHFLEIDTIDNQCVDSKTNRSMAIYVGNFGRGLFFQQVIVDLQPKFKEMELGNLYQFHVSLQDAMDSIYRRVLVHEQTIMEDFYLILQSVVEMQEVPTYLSAADFNDKSFRGKRVGEVFKEINHKVEIKIPLNRFAGSSSESASIIVVFEKTERPTDMDMRPFCFDCEISNKSAAISKLNTINTKLGNWNASFFKILSVRNRKKELEQIAKRLGLRIHSSLNKKEYAQGLEYIFIEYPELLKAVLSHSEMVLVSKLIDFGFNWGMFSDEEITTLEESLLVNVDNSLNRIKPYSVASNVALLLHDFIREACEDKAYIEACEVENYIIGISNLYGVIRVEKAMEMLNKYCVIEQGFEMFLDSIITNYRLNMRLYIKKFKNEYFIVNHLIGEDSDENFIADIELRKDLVYKQFSKEQVYEASNSRYYHHNTKATKIIEFLETKNFPDSQLAMHELWYGIQFNLDFSELIEIFSRSVGFDSEAQVRTLIDFVRDYSNSVPKWLLKGSSPVELFKPPSLMPFIPQKAQRNDPCPCGSGKKYKNCCGNN